MNGKNGGFWLRIGVVGLLSGYGAWRATAASARLGWIFLGLVLIALIVGRSRSSGT